MKQIDIARKYIGTKEQFGNKFMEDADKTNDSSEFAALIHLAGQKNGESWCCYTQEVFFCLTFPEREKELRKLFSASCFETYCNALKLGYKVVNYPVLGSVVIYQHVTDGIQSVKGHAAMVSNVISRVQFDDISGNTNSAGSREGEVIAEKTGHDTTRKEKGLQVLGFIII